MLNLSPISLILSEVNKVSDINDQKVTEHLYKNSEKTNLLQFKLYAKQI